MIEDFDLKRGIRAWANRLHVPVTRMMSRVLREEIHRAHEERQRREETMTNRRDRAFGALRTVLAAIGDGRGGRLLSDSMTNEIATAVAAMIEAERPRIRFFQGDEVSASPGSTTASDRLDLFSYDTSSSRAQELRLNFSRGLRAPEFDQLLGAIRYELEMMNGPPQEPRPEPAPPMDDAAFARINALQTITNGLAAAVKERLAPHPVESLSLTLSRDLSDEETANLARSIHEIMGAIRKPKPAEPQRSIERVRLDMKPEDAPIGTFAPSRMGGGWWKDKHGWCFESRSGEGGRGWPMSHPGKTWSGELVLPAAEDQPKASAITLSHAFYGTFAPSRVMSGEGWVKRWDTRLQRDGWFYRKADGDERSETSRPEPGNHWDGRLLGPGHVENPVRSPRPKASEV